MVENLMTHFPSQHRLTIYIGTGTSINARHLDWWAGSKNWLKMFVGNFLLGFSSRKNLLCTFGNKQSYGMGKWQERKNDKLFCVCDVSCQASPSRQLVQKISKLAEIIHNLGISTHQSRKLLTFLPDTSTHRMFTFFVKWRSNTVRLTSIYNPQI